MVIFAVIVWVIPQVLNDTTPEVNSEKAVTAFWFLAATHLILLVILIGKILVSRRGGRWRKTGLIIPGIILILMSMWLTDRAEVYLEHQCCMLSVAIILFFNAFCDLVTGIILIMLPTRLPDNQQTTFNSRP